MQTTTARVTREADPSQLIFGHVAFYGCFEALQKDVAIVGVEDRQPLAADIVTVWSAGLDINNRTRPVSG